ncbi:type 4b pilus protein PilO2 [Paraburkholderia sp. A1RI-2L]|uniref:type 4b pilus protein PilO2 n=1 Tax=Paraburkholderia sp. A1RI-2L TaxID=3028367 RepID=UPI003B79B7DA
MTDTVTLPGVKHTFAVGMTWRHEDAIPKEKQLRALSAEEGQWGIVRTTSTGAIQVAFCEPVSGMRAHNLKSLAAVVADHHPQPWMGLYKLADDRYWYIAVRDGQAVIPGGDRIGTFQEMARVRDAHVSAHGEWKEIEGTAADLAEMAQMTPSAKPLRDMQSSALALYAKVGLGTFLIGGLGLASFLAYQHFSDETNGNTGALNTSRPQAQTVNVQPPWLHAPMPSAVFENCHHAWSRQDLARKGWTLTGWTCTSASNAVSIATTWGRSGGLAVDAPGILSTDGESSTDTTTEPATYGAPSPQTTLEPAARRIIWSLAQSLGLTLNLSAQTPTAATLPGAAQQVPQVPWITIPAKFTSVAPPWSESPSAFDAADGLRISSVAWDSTSRVWALGGTLYASRPVPVPAPRPQQRPAAKTAGA